MGPTLVEVRGLLMAMTSVVAEHGAVGVWASVVAERGLSSCRIQA